MSLDGLPRDLLVRIVSCLDTDALRTLRLVSSRERDAATSCIRRLHVDSAEARASLLHFELRSLTALTHLELLAFSPSSLPLLSVPSCLQLLRRLDLDWHDASPAANAELLAHLAHASALTSLRFESYLPVQQIALFLRRCPRMIEMDLRLCDMDDSLGPTVSEHQTLQGLTCFLQRDAYFDQASALRHLAHVPRLRALLGVALTTADMARCIASMPSLTRLHVSRLVTGLNVLAMLSSLNVLEIDTTSFVGPHRLHGGSYPQALAPLTQLQGLLLGGSVDAHAATAILSTMTRLTELCVYNRLPVTVLARCSFPCMRQLRMDLVGSPAAAGAGAGSLWAPLVRMRSLDHLRLRIDEDVFRSLSYVLPELTLLTSLLLNIDHGEGAAVSWEAGGPALLPVWMPDPSLVLGGAVGDPGGWEGPGAAGSSRAGFLRGMSRLATLQLRGVLDERQWDEDMRYIIALTGLTRLLLGGSRPQYAKRLAFTSLVCLTRLTRLKTIVLLNPWSRITLQEEKVLRERLEESQHRLGLQAADLLLGYPRADA